MNAQRANAEQTPSQVLAVPYTDNAIDDGDTDLRQAVSFFLQNLWMILAVALLLAMVGVIYIFAATPVFQADALVQVESRSGGPKGLSDLTSVLLGDDASTEAEMEILRSRSVVGRVVEDLKLDISATPVRFPIIGGAFARFYRGTEPSAPPFGLSSYAWGGEAISLETLEVPDSLQGVPLTLLAGAAGEFKLYDPDNKLLLEGQVDKPATGHGVNLYLNQLIARQGTQFTISRKSRIQSILNLQASLKISEKGKKTGIIMVSQEGANVKFITSVVNALVENYLRQNVERRSEEAKKALDFLGAQLPRIRTELQSAETTLGEYRSKTGTLGMSLEAKAFVDASAQVEQQIALLRLQKAEFEQKYTGNHPTLVAVNRKLAQLESDRQKVAGRIKHLPETELEAVRLERDRLVANDVYVQVLNKVQELSLTKAGTIGSVRILDHAEITDIPIKPQKSLVLMLSIALGLLLGIGIAAARRTLLRGVEDPDEVERKLGLPVYAAIPHSELQANADRNKGGTSTRFVLAEASPQDLAIESVRSLRTSLQFAVIDSPNNIIMITGPSLGIGKSFISSNLAATLAESGKKILLIDADMRKGRLHKSFGMQRTKGLSGLISGDITFEAGASRNVLPNLDFIPCGISPPNPSELLMSESFHRLLLQFSSDYDIVIIDSPPALAVTDACIIGRMAGICFVVLGYSQHDIREIALTQKRLTQSGSKVHGVVFNNIPLSGLGYGYGRYYGYRYHYQYNYK